jgi:hypothetical protein
MASVACNTVLHGRRDAMERKGVGPRGSEFPEYNTMSRGTCHPAESNTKTQRHEEGGKCTNIVRHRVGPQGWEFPEYNSMNSPKRISGKDAMWGGLQGWQCNCHPNCGQNYHPNCARPDDRVGQQVRRFPFSGSLGKMGTRGNGVAGHWQRKSRSASGTFY